MISSLSEFGGGYSIAIREKTAYIAAGKEGLKVVDVSDPKSPLLKATVNTSGEARDIALSKSHALIADGAAGLVILDISNPSSPRQVASLTTSGYCRGVSAEGSLLCAGIKKNRCPPSRVSKGRRLVRYAG